MAEVRYTFTSPKNAFLLWLTNPGSHVPARIGTVLLGELFSTEKAVFAGLLNGLILNVVALCMHRGIFAIYIAADLALASARVFLTRRVAYAASRGQSPPTDLYLIAAIAWTVLQGAMVFTAMRTSNVSLQLLSATTAMGMIGPICARNYAAPRYAILLVAICTLGLVSGAALSGNPWLLVMVLQYPILIFGVTLIIGRFQTMAVTTLLAEKDSFERARHDALTGLLNRFGLMETLDARYRVTPGRFILFYLDLDGFKPINDTFGHQAGDKILQAVADRLRSAIRTDDIVSRLGGDEFVLVAPNMAPSDGADYAKTIIRKIADAPYLLEATGPLRIGISIGFACAPEDGVYGNDLHRNADMALYEAKAAGKGIQRRFTTRTSRQSLPVPLQAGGCQQHRQTAIQSDAAA